MDEVGARGRSGGMHECGDVERVEHRQLLQQDRALPPRCRLVDLVTPEHDRRGGLLGRVPRVEVGGAQQSRVRVTGRVDDGGAAQVGVDGLGDETAVERASGTLDLLVAAGSSGVRLGEDAPERVRQVGVREALTRGRDPPVGEVDRRRRRPVLREHVRDRRDRPHGSGDERVAVACVADGGAEHVGEGERAVPREQVEPGTERAGDDGGEVAGPRDEIEAEVGVRLDRGCRGCGALTAQDEGVTVCGAATDERRVATRAVEVGLDHAQREAGGRRGVERVAAGLEDPHPDGARKPVRRGDHADRADELRSGGEHLIDPAPCAQASRECLPTTSRYTPEGIRYREERPCPP
jgi:hypothetical protein